MPNNPDDLNNRQDFDSSQESLDLLKYWNMFLKRWPLGLAVWVVFLLLVFFLP